MSEQYYYNPVAEMAANHFVNGAAIIGTSAVLISAERSTRRSILIQNNSTYDIYIGDSSVTTSTGVRLRPGADITIYGKGAIYGISATAGCNVRYLEEYHE
jgi:hypothetical protein